MILDGKALSRQLNKALKGHVDGMATKPGLAVILVGSDPASEVYVRRKGVVAGRLGMVHRQINLPADTSQDAVGALVDELNADPAIHGILVQLPLPKGLDSKAVVERIDPSKDVDGLTTRSAGLLVQGRPHLLPCTPKGVMRLLAHADIALEGKRAVVVGRSILVGRPMALLLEQANCTVTVCHSRTRDLEGIVRESDVVVAALGRPEAIKGAWIKPGAVVVDVGINRLDDGRLVGDVEFAAAAERASAITPVPGGVGPMTIAMLMDNTVQACTASS